MKQKLVKKKLALCQAAAREGEKEKYKAVMPQLDHVLMVSGTRGGGNKPKDSTNSTATGGVSGGASKKNMSNMPVGGRTTNNGNTSSTIDSDQNDDDDDEAYKELENTMLALHHYIKKLEKDEERILERIEEVQNEHTRCGTTMKERFVSQQ